MTILEALDDSKLFAPFFKNRASWLRWRAFLAALFGLPMTDEEQAIYRHHTQRETLPTEQAREAWVVVGRRGGKSRVAALAGTFLATFRDYREYLAPGEVGTIPVISCDRKQSRTVMRYISAFFEHVPMLRRMVIRKTTEEIELSNRVVIEVHTATLRSTRGYTVCGAVCDEVAFWRTDDGSANPDHEIIAGLRPGMATIPGSLLLAISSPYARKGTLWEAYNKHFGKASPLLVWQGSTTEMNPSVAPHVIADAYEDDPIAAAAEFGGEFRKDVESYVSREVLEQVVIPGRHELPYCDKFRYHAFVDPSGGSQDSFTLAIAHQEKALTVLDLVREIIPPFSPEFAVAELCGALKAYNVHRVCGDRYGGAWVSEVFTKQHVSYHVSEMPKSDIYTNALPMFNSGRVELLDHARLKAQLLGLERRTGRGGKGVIDHPPRGHDDLANAVAGVLVAEAMGPRAPVLVRFLA